MNSCSFAGSLERSWGVGGCDLSTHLSISQLSKLTGQDRRTIAKRLSDWKHTDARAWRGDGTENCCSFLTSYSTDRVRYALPIVPFAFHHQRVQRFAYLLWAEFGNELFRLPFNVSSNRRLNPPAEISRTPGEHLPFLCESYASSLLRREACVVDFRTNLALGIVTYNGATLT